LKRSAPRDEVFRSGFSILDAGFAADEARSMRCSFCASDNVVSAIEQIAIVTTAIVAKRRVRVATSSDHRTRGKFFDFD
jgi:hypothetical protein